MHTLDHTKIFSTFALRQLLFGSVNLRFYQNLHKRLGVVNPSSKGTAISDCRKSGKATPFLFLIFKFFTNATISRKFTTREQQYLVCSVHPTKRGEKSLQKLATTEKCCTFASQLLHNCGANHRFYYNTHRRGEYHSYCIAICESCTSGKATLFLFNQLINFLKFFTNATFSRKFTTREQQYLVCSVHPTKRGVLSINIFRAMQVGAPILQERQVPLPMQNPTGALPLCNSPHTPRAGKPNLAKTQPIPRVNIFFHSFFTEDPCLYH